ncbi:4Fe-4S binding protein [Sedimentitalea nanhaiensis]|uniref:4Fe-4S dicluster domain-containing protein n=1 Tax=Sedimentitalea nanhaiensis TaxID=999627 RepID=A0A1I7ASG3_9RHOB|nr:4Fe-4S binding protein [Sedimentitalea nanhaiensis]SFT77909.1 4Fe-4S dicluster domain-containing protein [Sedimentitalea nanhaiensis]
MVKSLILCDCMGSQTLDADRLAGTQTVVCSRVHTALCTTQIEVAAQAMQGGDAIIACQQERAVFEDLAAELGIDPPGFVDLRDRAGWSEQGAQAGPKMAALVAEALVPATMTRNIDVVSDGTCLIAGPGEAILPLAAQLADSLAVTALITDDGDLPASRNFDAVRGRLRRVTGALGGFQITIDALQQVVPGGRGAFGLTPPRDGGQSACDIVIDLTGGTAMVPAPDKREGYLRADPRDPVAVARLAFVAVQLTGTFEKPLFLRLEETLCAHARAGQVGCSNCLDICPTGAITPAGDHVAIDPMICAGCGACAALCPSTAITYDDPPVAQLLARMETLARAFRGAGGGDPRLLVHDAHGAEMIRLAARFGRGIPADVIPLELKVISGFGHAEMLAALAYGFAGVTVLLAPTTEREALEREMALAAAIAGAGKVEMLDESDPDNMSRVLYHADKTCISTDFVLPMGNRRQIARLAAQALNPQAEARIDLPYGAPYGAVLVDTEACTLCLSCVSLCPSGALLDNPDMPQLRFQEDACLQCGICANICPEDAIALRPQLDLSDAALAQRVLNEEEPFACIECGALFGVKSTVERIMDKLAGSHPMFASSAQARMIQMCDNCRIKVQFAQGDNPFQGGAKPKVRTTEDYLSKRRDH